MRIRWRYLDLTYQHQRSLLMIDITIGWSRERGSIRFMHAVPIVTVPLTFVRKSSFTFRYIVHPGGGNAARLVCEGCGAEYPYGNSPMPCAFCAVAKESGVGVSLWGWSRYKTWRSQ